MGTVSKNRGMSCVGVRKTGTTLIRVSTVMGTLYSLYRWSCGINRNIVECKVCIDERVIGAFTVY